LRNCGVAVRGRRRVCSRKIVVGLGDDVTNFSSVRTSGGNASYLTRNVYEGLLTLNTEGKVVTGVASRLATI